MWVNEKDRRPYRVLRQQWMHHYQNQVGGPGALAQALDSTDTHISAMVKGRRNVGDELADKLENTFNLPLGTIDSRDPSGLIPDFSAGVQQQATPTLSQALAVLAGALSSVPVEKRQALLGVLATYASNPVAESNSLAYLQSELAKTEVPKGVHPSSIATGQPPGGKA